MTESPLARTSAEYILPDGSPRYGIRTEPVPDAPVKVAPPKANGAEDIFKRAATMNIAQLHAASTYAPLMLERDGQESLAELKEAHPKVLAKARRLVVKELGSSRDWRAQARKLRDEVELPTSGAPTQREFNLAMKGINFLVATVLLILLPVLVAFYLLSVEVPGELALVVYIVLSDTGRKYLNRLRRHLPILNAPVDVHQMQDLQEVIVDAVFIRLLQTRDVELDPVAVKAGLSRWEHLCFIADKVDQMWAYSRR